MRGRGSFNDAGDVFICTECQANAKQFIEVQREQAYFDEKIGIDLRQELKQRPVRLFVLFKNLETSFPQK